MRIGLLIEGGIDEVILPPLVEQLMSVLPEHRRRGLGYYPVPFPPNGYGEIPKNLKMLVRLYADANERRRIGCDLFVVVLDSRKTEEAWVPGGLWGGHSRDRGMGVGRYRERKQARFQGSPGTSIAESTREGSRPEEDVS